ncbi:hypothetical protein L596_006969 [Steinernema carpocapsae]|uniref:Uncharacterized protein n=1 Tax=Steinernema carpocapsae TaxID=34508 RepID=A0A4V6A5V6_STECR|nr:hypothetical protein L596_006969 [Steinernema carpocapsae]
MTSSRYAKQNLDRKNREKGKGESRVEGKTGRKKESKGKKENRPDSGLIDISGKETNEDARCDCVETIWKGHQNKTEKRDFGERRRLPGETGTWRHPEETNGDPSTNLTTDPSTEALGKVSRGVLKACGDGSRNWERGKRIRWVEKIHIIREEPGGVELCSLDTENTQNNTWVDGRYQVLFSRSQPNEEIRQFQINRIRRSSRPS